MMKYSMYVLVVALAGCTQMQSAADDVARKQAKNSVDIVVAQKLPGADVSRVTDCIIDNASAQELLKLSAATITGVDAKTTALVGEISSRPDTLKCIAQNALLSF